MERTIGIKVADGTFYPVLEDGYYGDKRLVLTTVRDNQSEVHIDLYQGSAAAGVSESRYIGSLIIENVRPVPRGSPDIEVVIGASREGSLNVSATDRSTGEEQSLSVSLRAEDQSEYDLPDFAVEGSGPAEEGLDETKDRGEEESGRPVDAGPSWSASPSPVQPRRRGVAGLVLLVALGLALIGVVAYFVYRSLQRPEAPAIEKPVEPASVAPAPKAAEPQKAAPAADQRAVTVTPPAAAAEPRTPPEGERGVRYRIKWGDTLWDLSSSYYRDPWLYPRIARANDIKNPDLIFAGTTVFIPER